MKITGNPSAQYYTYQDVQINMSSAQTFVLSGWAKAVSIPTTYDDNKTFSLRGIIVYSDDTFQPYDKPFNADSTEWQFVSSAILPEQIGKTISYIRVMCRYDYNANNAYFDNISLVRELAQTYNYNSDGRLTSVAATENDKVDYQYLPNGVDLWKEITGHSGTYTYSYDSAHNVKFVENNGVTMSMSYDSKGNITSNAIKGTSGSEINTTATYIDYGNLPEIITDSRGFKTKYTYDTELNKLAGLPSSTIEAYDTAKAITTNDSYKT
ncbi:MAG: hypothetical protein ACYCWE_06110 [Eubacteriales bacterium]